MRRYDEFQGDINRNKCYYLSLYLFIFKWLIFLKAAQKKRLNMKSGQQCGLKNIYTKINTLLLTFTASTWFIKWEHVLPIQVWINYLFQWHMKSKHFSFHFMERSKNFKISWNAPCVKLREYATNDSKQAVSPPTLFIKSPFFVWIR